MNKNKTKGIALKILQCTCHLFTLCANHAMNALPAYLDGLLKDASFYFAHVPEKFYTNSR